MVTGRAFKILTLLICDSNAQTLWYYDPTTWRATPDTKLNFGNFSLFPSQTLDECKQTCIDVGIGCSSITWDGDVDDNTATGTCTLYVTKFGFPANGFVLSQGKIGAGKQRRLEFKGGTTYFEKPMDYGLISTIDSSWYTTETLHHHLIANALRLNKFGYQVYEAQQNGHLDYDQFLMYYRDGQPGYVNNSADQLTNKYSVIVEYEVEDAEECAKFCTRNRGSIDADLGTRCASFNYHTLNIYCIFQIHCTPKLTGNCNSHVYTQ